MSKFSSPNIEHKGRGSPATWPAGSLQAFGSQLFARDDRAASEHGWQISVRQGGLGRRYRDPRFSSLTGCPWCRGSGRDRERDCRACLGTGRLRRPAGSPSPGRRCCR